MRRSTAPTLKDVAREAGVSSVTVSVVLNGSVSGTRVSDSTRNRIREAAERLHYRPNSVAQGLSRRRMDTLGIVAMVDGLEVNQYFLEILNGILLSVTEYRQNLMVFSLSPHDDIAAQAPQLCDGRVDGLIFLGLSRLDAFSAEPFVRREIPFVVMHNTCDTPGIWNLDSKSVEGARQIVAHLISLGHRQIFHFTGEPHITDVQRRLAGYRQALDEAGIPYDERLVISGNYSAYSGRERMRNLLREGVFDPLPTAVFCGNDAIASGCIEALGEHGLRVPEQMSVVGYDDTLTARLTSPLLTTVRQPFSQMARRAVTLVLQQINGEVPVASNKPRLAAPDVSYSEPGTEYFDIELALRASAGPPPAQRISPPYRREA